MNRRTFLKSVGLAACGLGSLGSLSSSSGLFGKLVVESTRDYFRNQATRLKTVTIDGKEHYLMFMHPRQKYALDVIVARDKYKHERWIPRYNKWAQSQGKPPYIEVAALY